MYDYPNQTTIEGILSFPTQSSPNFWLYILIAIFLIFTLSSYNREVKVFGRGKFLSSLVVSSFFITVLGTVGTLVGFITSEILIYIIIFFAIFTAIFFFSSKE
jgi:fatty acid desaturase